MLIDGRNPPPSQSPYDLCIVGTGAAGQTIYREFGDSALRVALVESGGLKPDAETQNLRRTSSAGIQIDLDSRQRYLGGTLNTWQQACVPMDRIDFQPRSWVPLSGWPLRRKELDPYYRRAAGLLGIPGPEEFGTALKELLSPDPNQRAEQVRATMVVYASSWQGFGPDLLSGLQGCDHHHLFLYSNLIAIRLDEAGRHVRSFDFQALGGPRFHIEARAYVLACGAVENARLLLFSGLPGPGVGNSSDFVGRCFMEHPKGEYGRLQLRAGVETRPWTEFEHRGLRWACGLRASPQMQRFWGMLNSAVRLKPEGAAPGYLKLKNFHEMKPDPSNRVTLGPDKDPLGLPRAAITCRLSEAEHLDMIRLHQLLREHFEAVGLGRMEGSLELQLGRWPLTRDASHHMGTTRMGSDPGKSVVNTNSRLHQVDNLYMAGSSVFATSGHSNPTYTIIALSLRLADHLKGILR